MKTALSFGLLLAAASTLFACSEDEGTECRTNCGGSGNATGNQGGTSNTGNGGTSSAGTSNAGNAGTAGAGPSGPPMGTLGDALTITGEGTETNTGPMFQTTIENSVREPATGIDGAAFTSRSTEMASGLDFSIAGGKLCVKGETVAVVNDNYGVAWGAELLIDLLRPQGPVGGGDAGADAGADAGDGIVQPTGAWPANNVIGFAYTIEGNNPAAADGGNGVPTLGLRFKSLPEGAFGENDTYCSTRCAGPSCPASGATDYVYFSDITHECWAMGNPSLADDMIPMEGPVADEVAPLVPNPRAFANISWQINADPGVTKPFDFCVSNIRPILAP